jgi:peptidoglycan-associated lipoprotein
MRLTLALTVSAAVVIAAAAACGGGPPPPPPEPTVDSAAIRDSIARARADSIARAQARRDSIARAERLAQARADSIARVRAETEAVRNMIQEMINFDFDRSNIRPGQDRQRLEQKLAILQANPNLRIEIVGHCDERGSDEYNMALGQRRANSARQFLVDQGVNANRISTRSMGEEQPLNPASNEAAWTQNRRDEFRIVSGGDMLTRPSGM